MAEQLFQIGIKALITNDKKQILMVHIPTWGDKPAHWDLPGGRMDPGESFLETLDRELHEEIGSGYIGQPEHVATMLTPIRIPVGNIDYPLLFVIYKTQLTNNNAVRLNPHSSEDDFKWFEPSEAAEKMSFKFSDDFRRQVSSLTRP